MSNLKTDKNLDKHLKPVKSDVENTSLQLATEGNGAKITGDLTVTGTVDIKTEGTLQANKLQSNSNGESYVGLSNDIDLVSYADIQISPTRTVTLGESGQSGYIYVKKPIRIEEQASADNDLAGYGQVWVRSSSPNDLYFTDDTGQDVRITNNGSLASSGGGGGSSYVVLGPFTARVGSISNDTNFWMAGSYGLGYPFWSTNNALTDRDKGGHDTAEYLMSSRVIHVPFDSTLKGFTGTFYTSASSTEYLFEIWKATPSYPTSTASDLVFSEATTFTSSGSTAYKMCQISKTDANVSLSAGDVLAIYTSRASGSGSGYVYLSMNVLLEKS